MSCLAMFLLIIGAGLLGSGPRSDRRAGLVCIVLAVGLVALESTLRAVYR